MEDHYKILELTDDDKKLNPDEFKKKVKSNYRRLSKKHHPDVGGDADMFKKINEANQILSDDTSRSDYDNGHKSRRWEPQYRKPDISFIKRQRSKHVQVILPVTIFADPEADVKIDNITTHKVCDTCNGSGGDSKKTCGLCHGIGYMDFAFAKGRCPSCGGSGTRNHGCHKCNHSGYISVQEPIKFKLSDIDIDWCVIIDGGGDYISSEVGYADLIINILLRDDGGFSHDMNSRGDIHQTIELMYYDYLLGKTIEVNTISGKKLKVTIPNLINTNTPLRVKGHGIALSRITGDMYLHLNVTYPKVISDEEKKYIELIREL